MEIITFQIFLLGCLNMVLFLGIILILYRLKNNDVKKEIELINNELYNISGFLETIIKDQKNMKRYLEMIDLKFDNLKKYDNGN